MKLFGYLCQFFRFWRRVLRDGGLRLRDRGACISWKCRSAGSSSSRFFLFGWSLLVVTGRYVVISSQFLMRLFLFLVQRSLCSVAETVRACCCTYFCAREAQIKSSPPIHGMLHLDCDIPLLVFTLLGERRHSCRFEREWWVQLSGCIACNLILMALLLLCRDDRGVNSHCQFS